MPNEFFFRINGLSIYMKEGSEEQMEKELRWIIR
jgi:hypothetical protein